MKTENKIIIIGGGIIGLAIAREILFRGFSKNVIVLEKENCICKHQSGRNSGVLHCGLYYKPGSLKAILAVDGLQKMVAFCKNNKIAYDICGKIVVATNYEEEKRLSHLYETGMSNGLRDLELLDTAGIMTIEPYVRGVAAIKVPQEGIVDYMEVAEKMKNDITSAAGKILLDECVMSIESTQHRVKVKTKNNSYICDKMINCGGLYSDRIYKMYGTSDTSKIIPFRGDYYKLSEKGKRLVKNLVYPVPHPKFPFLGVHFTRTIQGEILAGPNASLVLNREGYQSFAPEFKDTREILTYPGLWRFLRKYPHESLGEIRNSVSKKYFLNNLQKLIPELQPDDLGERHPAGIRAQAMKRTGDLQMDFELKFEENQVHVVNAPSPGATASLAIAEYVVNHMER
jgi:(S)-2-hydroxyglutarate dehydrogenase